MQNHPRYAIISAGVGTELLLHVLFEELNEHSRKDIKLGIKLQESLEKIRRKKKKTDLREPDLSFKDWIDRYQVGGILSDVLCFCYELDEFSIAIFTVSETFETDVAIRTTTDMTARASIKKFIRMRTRYARASTRSYSRPNESLKMI